MISFQLSEEQSIDSLIAAFEGKYGAVKPTSRPDYTKFIFDLVGETFVSEIEFYDQVLLFSYVIGDRPIVDKDTKKERYVKGLEDLTLLSLVNIISKDKQGNWLSPELFRLLGRISSRKLNYDAPNWHQTLDKIFQEPDVISYLKGKASYEEHVNRNQIRLQPPPKIDRPMEEHIPEELIPLWVSYKTTMTLRLEML